MALRIASAVVLIVLVVAGCSPRQLTPAASRTGRSAGTAAASPTTDRGQCGVYRSDANVRVLLTPGNNGECQALAQQLSADGSFWTIRSQPVDEDQLALVCAMQKSGYFVLVEDSSTQIYGHQLCSMFLTEGWTEDTAAEDQAASASSAASESEAEASALASQSQAAASSSAVAADQLARDDDSAAQLVSAVKATPVQLSDAVKKTDADLQQTLADLASTKSEAAKGQGDSCSNVNTVFVDATDVVGEDATDKVGIDAADDIAPLISQLRQNLESLAQLEQTLSGEGGNPPGDAASASSDANKAITTTIDATNSDIDKANAAAADALQVARKMATGNCTGYMPGSFQPVQHLN